MNEEKGTRKKAKRPPACLFAFCLFPFSFCLLAGCSAAYHEPNDPFYGPQVTAPRPPSTTAAGTTGATTTAGPGKGTPPGTLPPLPQPNGAFSPATLAPGNRPPLDSNPDLRGDSGLRIGGTPSAIPASGQGQRSAPGITLSGPTATIDPGPTPALVPAIVPAPPPTPPIIVPAPPPAVSPPPASTTTSKSSEEALMAWLKAHGMAWSRSDWNAQDGYHFSCGIADPLNPNVRKVYEARNPDHLAAIQAVVDRLSQQK